jgi:hypothetical protein
MSEIGNTYKGLDICAILVKQKDKPDNDWICAFLKIRFTKEDKNEILDIYHKRQKHVGIQDYEYLVVKLFYYEMDMAQDFLQDITKGHIEIEGIRCIIEGNYIQIQTNEAINVSGKSAHSQRYSKELHKMISSTMNEFFVVPYIESMVGRTM